MKIHPYAEIFPLMSDKEFDDLCADISLNGQREPIRTLNNQILDGRNRFNACKKLGIVPQYKDYFGGDVLGFVISSNLIRRHLNESQRAMVADKLATLTQGRQPNKDANLHLKATREEAAKTLNVSKRSVADAHKVQTKGEKVLIESVEQGKLAVSVGAQIAELPKAEQKDLLENFDKSVLLEKVKEIRATKATANRSKRVEKISQEMPDGKFAVILADPPWAYEHSETVSREIENQYPTMKLEDIKALTVPAADNSILFLWATAPKLTEALEVMSAWGFNYRSCAVWDKEHIGMGYYFRVQHELLLIGTKGDIPAPEASARVSSVIRVKKTQHSAKPEIVYEIIEKMYDLPKIELFARQARDGWHSWGNENV